MEREGIKARNYDCHLKNDEYVLTGCIFGDQTIEPKYALVGDSHARSIHQRIGQKFSELNKSFVLYAKNACPPSLLIEGTHAINCPMFNQNVIEDLVKKKIKTVILFSRFSWYLEINGFKNSYGVREDKNLQHFVEGSSLSIENQVDEKLESMSSFIRVLKRNNIQVLFVEPIPEMGWKIPNLKVKSLKYNLPMPAIDRREYEQTTEKRFIKFVKPLLHTDGVRVIETSDLFCDKNVCFGERNGNLIYYDDDHPSDSASQMIAERVIKYLF